MSASRETYLDAQEVERPYAAGDPELLLWVHTVFTDAFLSCHQIWGGAIPGGPRQVCAGVGHRRQAHRCG